MANDLVKANPSRYDQAAQSYDEGRLHYSSRLIEHVVAAAGVGPDSTVLDLGCGPGTIANKIADHCGQVIAVDPSEAMLEAGRARAPGNVTYVQGSSDDLSFIDRPLQLVTFGRSFHWMDRAATLETLDKMTTPDAGLAFLYVAPLPGKSKEHEWYYAMLRASKTLSNLGGSSDKAIDPNAEREEFIILRSAFCEVTMFTHYEKTEWTFQRALAWLLSRYSAGSKDDDAEQRKSEARDILAKALKPYGDEPWTTMTQQRVIMAKRPA